MTTPPSKVVKEPGQNDVLMGKGQPALEHEGNRRFRALVKTMLPCYLAAGRRAEKDRIAKLVVQTVKNRNGRFLRRVESPSEAEQLDMETCNGIWLVAEDKHILPKVKQTFRDQHSVAGKTKASESSSSQNRRIDTVGPSFISVQPNAFSPLPVAPLALPPAPLMTPPHAASLWQLQQQQFQQRHQDLLYRSLAGFNVHNQRWSMAETLFATPRTNQQGILPQLPATQLQQQHQEQVRQPGGLDLLAGVASREVESSSPLPTKHAPPPPLSNNGPERGKQEDQNTADSEDPG